MVLVLPEIPSYSTRLAGSLSKGMQNASQSYAEALQGKRQREAQYGALGSQIFDQYNPDATPQEKANFYKMSANMQKRKESPQDMYSRIADMATQHKNVTARAQSSVSPDRILQNVKDLASGKTKSDKERQKAVLDKNIKPMIENGESMRVRNILSNSGLAAEEIESHVAPLSEQAKKTIERFPNFNQNKLGKAIHGFLTRGQGKEGGFEGLLSPSLADDQKQFFRSNLESALKEDPNLNLLLARKEYEDKGVNWRDFRDAVLDLESEGKVDFSKNEDQQYMINKLYDPPLGGLKQILHGLKFIGR